jgi:methionine-rich copper-binding protein CopC
MIALPYDYFLIAWFVLAVASTAYVVVNQFRNNPIKGIRMTKMTSIAAIAMIAAMLCGNAAYAHPEMQSAEPPAGGTTASPKQIKITFNENVMAQFSGVELRDRAGKMIPTGKAAVDPANKKQLVVPLNEPLPPGDYKVEWHAVSDDTHRVKGNYSFSVAP